MSSSKARDNRTRVASLGPPAAMLIASAMLLFAGVACNSSGPIRVGAKPFPEQRILAEMTVALLSDAGYATRPVRVCEDTYDCQRKLQSGRLDLMVEYTGTALHMLGEEVPPGRQQYDYLQEIYEPLGLEWLAPLGFDNAYWWMMPPDRAATLGVDTLEDLAELDRPITVACGPEYVRRPRDGLDATARRYGIELSNDPVVAQDSRERYRAVIDGRADVVVGYATDGMLEQLGMRRLNDTLDFMPRYDAALLAYKKRLEQQPGVREALDRLEDTLDSKTMQNLNHAVSVRGRSPGSVAREFLAARDLIGGGENAADKPVVEIARSANSPHRQTSSKALQAVRTIFPHSVVRYRDTDAPSEAVIDGRTRLALIGAERFFRRDKSSGLRRLGGIEAVAVAGTRAVHVLAGPQVPADADPLEGDIGMTRSSLADHLTRATGISPTLRASNERLVDALRNGEIDRAIIAAPPGGPDISELMADHGFRLLGLSRRNLSEAQFGLPFLRPARISATTYPGTNATVETVSMQVVLAGPAGDGHHLGDANGPAAALETRAAPFSIHQAEQLADALGIDQAPDPALPATINPRGPDHRDSRSNKFTERIVDAILNLLVIVFLAWLAYITIFNASPRNTES